MRDRSSFREILETLEIPEADARRGDGFANPLSTAAAPISQGCDHPGAENQWDHAFAWAVDSRPPEAPREPPAAPAAARAAPSGDAETIAAELGLTSASTRGEVQSARRRFMWRNHPDRSPDIPADLANRRAAIANRLVDRALRELSRRGRSS
jgi:hypothetical protein